MVSRVGNSQFNGRDSLATQLGVFRATPTLAEARSFSLGAARHYKEVLEHYFRGHVTQGAVGVARVEWQRWESLVVELRRKEQKSLEKLVRR